MKDRKMNQVLTHEETDYELLPPKQLYEAFDIIRRLCEFNSKVSSEHQIKYDNRFDHNYYHFNNISVKNYEKWRVVLFDTAGMGFNPKFTTVCRFDQNFTEILKNTLSREYNYDLIHEFVNLILSTDGYQFELDYKHYKELHMYDEMREWLFNGTKPISDLSWFNDQEKTHEEAKEWITGILDQDQKRRDDLRSQSKELINKIINISPLHSLKIDQVDL